ncbi:MAG: hypothetical protein H7645_02785 [Candidatus Heimdallarchaeota archaeon]|nr:hypothetical protein [Candidatus Heimdallarchaeota archaeon]MCK4769241.1 hypothetical protein [Candidatus Heimdallarchaeota archaeon]
MVPDDQKFSSSLSGSITFQSFKGYIEYSGIFLILASSFLPLPGFIISLGAIFLLISIVLLYRGIGFLDSLMESSKRIMIISRLFLMFWVLLYVSTHIIHIIFFFLPSYLFLILFIIQSAVQIVTFISLYIFFQQFNRTHLRKNKSFNWIFIIYTVYGIIRIVPFINYDSFSKVFWYITIINSIILVLVGIVLIRTSVLMARKFRDTNQESELI